MAYNERWSSCACSHACVLLWEISASYAWWESKNWGLREGTCIKLAQTCIYYTTLLFCFLFLQHLLGSFLQSSQLADQLATQLVSGYILIIIYPSSVPWSNVTQLFRSVLFRSVRYIYHVNVGSPILGTPGLHIHRFGNPVYKSTYTWEHISPYLVIYMMTPA